MAKAAAVVANSTKKPPVSRSLERLVLGHSSDQLEHEANRAEERVHSNFPSALAWSLSSVGSDSPIQRQCACHGTCEKCRKKPRIQRKATGDPIAAHDTELVQDVLRRTGQELDRGSREFMESRFGFNFGHVRIFTGELAADSASAVAANAYTVGNKIVFNRGKYAPHTASGRRLLAHELAHVVQQTQQPGSTLASRQNLESEAGRISDQISHREVPQVVQHRSAVGLARDAAPASQILIEVKLPEGTKRLTQTEFDEYKRRALSNLRRDLLLLSQFADLGRQSQVSMLAEYQGGVESLWDVAKKPKALFGIAADLRAGVTPPHVGAWDFSKTTAAQGIAACDRQDLGSAARILERANQQYRETMHAWNSYRLATIGGAEKVASDLETVRDISFAIALVAGAAIAAPVIAGVVGTGAVGTALTAGGTAIVTGAGGAALGGGSTALASKAMTGKVDWKGTRAAASKFGKEGAVTGLTAGLGASINVAGKGATIARATLQKSVQRCVVEGGISVSAEATSQVLDEYLPAENQDEIRESNKKALLPPEARAAVTGCLSGVMGVPVAKLGRTGGKVSEVAVNVGVGYADARLSGKSNKEALIAGAQSAVTSAAVARGHAGTVRSKSVKVSSESALRAPASTASEPHVMTSEAKSGAVGHQSTEASSVRSRPTPAEKQRKKLTKTQDREGPAAIFKEDAKAKRPLGDGHEVVVSEQGIAKCSPSPCPVIHVEYADELKKYPWLNQRYKEIQKRRSSNPVEAAKEAQRLVAALEILKNNQGPTPAAHPAQAIRKYNTNVDLPRAYAQQFKEHPWVKRRYAEIQKLRKGSPEVARQAEFETLKLVADLEKLKQDPNSFGFDDVRQGLGNQPETRHRGGIREAFADAKKAGFVDKKGAPGKVDAAFQPHGSASTVRDAARVKGKNVQSAHIGPTSALRKLSGYSLSEALTMLLPSQTHAAFDAHWKSWAKDQRRQGRKQATVGELHQIMVAAIQQTPDIPPKTKGAMIWQLGIELYRDLGLKPGQLFDLPYPNVQKMP